MSLEQKLNVFGRKLGHELGVFQRPNGRWVVNCSCGWESTGRRTLADCLGAGRHHLWLLYRQTRDSGVSPETITVRGA